MCIISKEVNAVSKTKLFASLDDTGTRQLTVYSNQVDTDTSDNAMILPVPNPNTVEFVDLSEYFMVILG